MQAQGAKRRWNINDETQRDLSKGGTYRSIAGVNGTNRHVKVCRCKQLLKTDAISRPEETGAGNSVTGTQ